jgi:hypothetical protein
MDEVKPPRPTGEAPSVAWDLSQQPVHDCCGARRPCGRRELAAAEPGARGRRCQGAFSPSRSTVARSEASVSVISRAKAWGLALTRTCAPWDAANAR